MSDREFARWALMVICILCAVGLMAAGKDGWGWLLFVAVLIG